MSLFNQASLAVTPNGYKAGKLYSIKPTNGAGDLDVVRATGATRVNASGLIETVANNVPRLDYPPLGGCPSILVEPQRTNLITYSEEFDNVAYNKFNLSVTANSLLSPDGTANADKIIENTANNTHQVFRSILPSGVCISYVFAKQGERKNLLLGNSTFGDFAVFDLNNGTVVSISGGKISSPKIESYGNGWYRCSVVNTNDDLSSLAIGIADNLGNVSYTGDGTSGLFIWGAQVEVGSYATSYIPTVASTVTRNADVISKTGVSDLIGQTEGTLYAEIKVNKLIGTAARYIFHLSDGTVNNRIYMAFSGSSSNVLRARIFNGGTLQCTIDTSALTNTGTYKLALAYKNNDIVFYVNGVQIGVDTSATIPTCSRVDLGQNHSGASLLGDGINNANIWKERLDNATLAQLTTL